MARCWILALALLASCSALSSRPAPAELRTSLPLEYRASLTSHGAEAAEPREPGTATSERRVEIQVVVQSGSEREAEAQLGELALRPAAWILDGAEATSLLATFGELVTAPRLTVFDGLRSHFAVLDERAYVSGFELSSGDGAAMIADPVVATLRLGTSFDARASVGAADAVELEIDWHLRELDEDLPELEHALFGGATVCLQVPLAMHQQLTTHARLRAGECIVLSCRGADGRHQIAVVSARALDA